MTEAGLPGSRRANPGVLLLAGLVVSISGCAAHPRRVQVRPAKSVDAAAIHIPFATSSTEVFVAADGRRCAAVRRQVSNGCFGWEARGEDDFACTMDTFEQGLRPAVLELRFRLPIAADGNYDLIALGYSVGAWGRVVARGSFYGDYFAKAEVSIQVRSPHCWINWTKDLAHAEVTGPWSREAPFSGWVDIPSLPLTGCKAHDPIEVLVRLVGSSNRGLVDVSWFGFDASSDEEINGIFALRPRGALKR